MTRAARAVWFAAAPVVSLLLFWRAFFTWFLGDDFAWLGKPLEVNTWHDLPRALFAPEAQGTVRVLSERLFFLVFTPLFGLDALPYRVIVMATWSADLVLALLIGARLTGSRAAGLCAAILWAASENLVYPLMRISAYNEILYSFCLLLAFYARLRWLESNERKWQATEWIAYLAGFGALEIAVMYPALALLHALTMARKKWRSALPLFAPAAIFAGLHFFLIPKSASGIYAIILDRRMPRTFLHYLAFALGPADLGDYVKHAHRPAVAGICAIGAALLVFSIVRLRRGEWLPLFCAGWFALLIVPVVPLANHIFNYYLTLPELGLAWLAGWAIVNGWRAGIGLRVLTAALCGAWLAASVIAIDAATAWYYEHSTAVRAMVLGVREAARRYPGSAIFLAGVDSDLFGLGIQDDPFRLFRLKQVYLIPGGEDSVHARADLGGVGRWVSSPHSALHAIESGQGHVYQVMPNELHEITTIYAAMLRTDPRATRIDFVDAGDASYAAQLGPTWYAAEGGLRWMPKSATVRMSGPLSAAARLYVTGYVPPAVVAAGPVTLTFAAEGNKLGEGKLTSDGTFTFDFALPAALVGRKEMEIAIEASRVVRPPTDPRDFGAAFGTFAIR